MAKKLTVDKALELIKQELADFKEQLMLGGKSEEEANNECQDLLIKVIKEQAKTISQERKE